MRIDTPPIPQPSTAPSLPDEDENWLLDLMNSPDVLCFRCGKNPGRKCDVLYKRSNRTKRTVLCEACADVTVRQHQCEITWLTSTAPETAQGATQ